MKLLHYSLILIELRAVRSLFEAPQERCAEYCSLENHPQIRRIHLAHIRNQELVSQFVDG